MFRAFGHHRSSILDGGLLGWQAHGGQTESGESENVRASAYPTPSLDKDAVTGALLKWATARSVWLKFIRLRTNGDQR